MYVLVPDGTELLDVGYPLDNSGPIRAFLDENVCFMMSDIDGKLTKLLTYDGAHIIGGQSGLFLAICYQIEASGHLPRREFLLEGRGTKQNVRGACQSQQQRHSRSAPHPTHHHTNLPTHPPTQSAIRMSDSKPYGTRPNSHPSQPPAPALAHLPYRSRCPQCSLSGAAASSWSTRNQ